MRRKTYLLTLVLFLLFFNGSILLVSIVNLKTSMDSTRRSCLGEYSFITAALTKDMNAMESRGAAVKIALPSLIDSYVGYYGKQDVYLKLSQNGEILYSNLPQGQKLMEKHEVPPSGKRIVGACKSQDRKYIVIVGALPSPYHSYVLSYYYDLSKLTASWKQMTNLLFLAGIAVSSLLALCLMMLLNRIFAPLRQISEASQSIAEGNYGNRLPAEGRDELADMANSFNNMAAAIENQIGQLSEAAEQKQRFIDNFAHELRTPLTSIYGYAEYIQKAAITEEDKLEATSYIMSESCRLQNIAYRLLELASLRSGDITLGAVIVEYLFKNTVEVLRSKAEEKQVTLCYECAIAELPGDCDLLQSLLINLVDNAIKACQPGGCVKIKALDEGEGKVILVEDNGRGMTQEQLSHITEAFYRVDKPRSRTEGGVGLGLAICEQIAACHDAELSFESQPGQGTKTKVIFTTL